MEQDSRLTAGAIEAEAVKVAPEAGLKPPSARTIARIQADWRALTADQRLAYRYFTWPESVGEIIPWEGSLAALELVRLLHDQGAARPLVRLVKWWWRVCVASPHAPADIRLRVARLLAVNEVLWMKRENSEATEWFLAYGPWQSEEDLEAYRSAVPPDLFIDPAATEPPAIVVPPGASVDSLFEAMEILMGREWPTEAKAFFTVATRELGLLDAESAIAPAFRKEGKA